MSSGFRDFLQDAPKMVTALKFLHEIRTRVFVDGLHKKVNFCPLPALTVGNLTTPEGSFPESEPYPTTPEVDYRVTGYSVKSFIGYICPGTKRVNEITDSVVFRVGLDIGYVFSGTNGYPINDLWCIKLVREDNMNN